MSVKKIKDDIDEIKKSKGTAECRKPFETLEDFKSGKITGEEALAILEDDNEPFAEMQRVIIKSALLTDDEKRKRVIK